MQNFNINLLKDKQEARLEILKTQILNIWHNVLPKQAKICDAADITKFVQALGYPESENWPEISLNTNNTVSARIESFTIEDIENMEQDGVFNLFASQKECWENEFASIKMQVENLQPLPKELPISKRICAGVGVVPSSPCSIETFQHATKHNAQLKEKKALLDTYINELSNTEAVLEDWHSVCDAHQAYQQTTQQMYLNLHQHLTLQHEEF